MFIATVLFPFVTYLLTLICSFSISEVSWKDVLSLGFNFSTLVWHSFCNSSLSQAFMLWARLRCFCRIAWVVLKKVYFLLNFSCITSAFCIQSASSMLLAVILRHHINEEKIQHPRVSALQDIFLSHHIFNHQLYVLVTIDGVWIGNWIY
jgi:hypothetical protein